MSNLDKWFKVRPFIRENIVLDVQDLIDETVQYLDEHKGINSETRAECEEFIEAYERLLDVIKSSPNSPKDANELALKVVA